MRVHHRQLLCCHYTRFPCRRSRAKPEQSCCSFWGIPSIFGSKSRLSSLKRGCPQKKRSDRIVTKQISYATTTPSKIRSRNWLRSPKRKSFVVNIRKPMSESFGLIPKREHLSTRLQN